MSRIVFRSLLLLALGALSSLVSPGCAENRSTLFIAGVMAKTDDCVTNFDPGQARIGRGMWDSAIPTGYMPPVLVGNQMVPQGNNNQIRTETSRILLEGAEVRLTSLQNGQEVAHFTTVISGLVNPAPAAAPGYYGAHIMMIPPGLDLQSGDYTATVRVFGSTLGGQEVESSEFVFPIGVCQRCLLVGDVDEEGQCLPAASTGDLVGRCRPGQDGETHCAVCQRLRGGPDPICDPL